MSDSAELFRRRLMAVADGTYDCGIDYDPSTVLAGFYNSGTLKRGISATVCTKIIPVNSSEANVTFFVAAETVDGTTYTPGDTDLKLSYGLLKDGAYNSWYQLQRFNGVNTRPATYSGTNQLQFSLPIFGIERSYAYFKETGRVLFAGKASPYYGKANVND